MAVMVMMMVMVVRHVLMVVSLSETNKREKEGGKSRQKESYKENSTFTSPLSLSPTPTLN